MPKKPVRQVDWIKLKEEFFAIEGTNVTAFIRDKFPGQHIRNFAGKTGGWGAEKQSKIDALAKVTRERLEVQMEEFATLRADQIRKTFESYLKIATLGIDRVTARLERDKEAILSMTGDIHDIDLSPKSIMALTTAAKNLMEVSKFAQGIEGPQGSLEGNERATRASLLSRIRQVQSGNLAAGTDNSEVL